MDYDKLLADSTFEFTFTNGQQIKCIVDPEIFVTYSNLDNSDRETFMIYCIGFDFLQRGAFDVAKSFLEEAIARGSSRAMFDLGNYYIKNGPEILGIGHLENAIANGYGLACSYLGNFYLNVRKDREMAILTYERGVDMKDAASANNLGMLYHKISPVNLRAAQDYYTVAVNLDCTYAMINLGTLFYEKGRKSLAMLYFRLAADHGDTNAVITLRSLGIADKDLTNSRHLKDEDLQHLHEASNGGNIMASCVLATYYKENDDIENMLKFQRILADSGNIEHMNEFANICAQHMLCDDAHTYFKLAISNGSAKAINDYAIFLYKNGEPIKKVRQMLEDASKKGYHAALSNLGMLYIRLDIPTALKYFDQAIAFDIAPAMFNKGCILEKRNQIGEAMQLFNKASQKGLCEATQKLIDFYVKNKQNEMIKKYKKLLHEQQKSTHLDFVNINQKK